MAFGQFRGLWRYASLYDLRNIVAAVLSSSFGFFAGPLDHSPSPTTRGPSFLIDSLVLIVLLGGVAHGQAGLPSKCAMRPAARRC